MGEGEFCKSPHPVHEGIVNRTELFIVKILYDFRVELEIVLAEFFNRLGRIQYAFQFFHNPIQFLK